VYVRDYAAKHIFGLTQDAGRLKAVRQIGTVPQGLVPCPFRHRRSRPPLAVGYEAMIYQLDLVKLVGTMQNAKTVQ
jgi:hypothetical protein